MAEENGFHGPPAIPISAASLGQHILEKLRQHGHEIAMVDALNGDSITYYDAYRKSVILAQNLQTFGIQKDDSIGICSENVVNFCLPAFASAYLGTACAPYNNLYSEGELLHVMKISRPRVVFASASTLEKILKVASQIENVQNVVLIYGTPPPDCTGFIPLSDLLQPVGQPFHMFQPIAVDAAKDTAAILCSSGTTGLAKGVELTHTNILTFISLFNLLNPVVRNDVYPGLVPYYHGYGYGVMFSSFSVGVKLVSMPRFEDKLFLSAIERYKISHLFIVPPIMVFLGKSKMVDDFDLSSLKSITCAAAPLSKEAEAAVFERLHIIEIRQAYGLIECTLLAAVVFDEGANKEGSCGRLVPGISAKVVDIETGKSLPRNKPGLLLLKGPSIMKGYRNNPKETAEAFDNGWLVTGDIVYLDEDDFMFVVDRVKELIKYNGFQVAPAELEAILYTHPGIRDAGVVGLPDDKSGELPLAFVIRQPNSNVTEVEILDYVADRVSPQKRLRGGVRFVDEIPRNPSGKILRRVLRLKL